MFGFGKFIRGAYRSSKWNQVRKQHLLENPNCIVCGKTDKLEVHHIEPVHINSDRELDPENLATLCASPCHLVFGHLFNWKKYNKDVIKDAKVYLNKVKNFPL